MKRMIVNLMAVCLLLCSLAPAAMALGPSDSGTWGENITWKLEDYTLTVSGEGEMEDGCPWEKYESKIEHVIIADGVTKIGAKAFYGFDSIETVEFGNTLVEIGSNAFRGCDDIDYIHLPATFRTFGASAFQECASLKYVYCEGPMPKFSSGCLWTGNYISVFYRTDNLWPVDAVHSMVSAYGGMMGINMGNFEDAVLDAEVVENHKDEDEEDQEETEAAQETEATEETVKETVEETVAVVAAEVVTVPETEPETEPAVTETEPTEAETEPATVPTTMPEETEAETVAAAEETEEPAAEEENGLEGKSWIGLVLIAGVLTFFIVGALIFKIASRRGGRYTN